MGLLQITCTIIFSSFACLAAQRIVQPQRFVWVRPSQAVDVECFQRQSDLPVMYWYAQYQGQGLQLLVHSYRTEPPELTAGYEGKVSATRGNDGSYQLQLKRLEAGDSGWYFCACSDDWGSNSQQYFGRGTQLTVLEEGLSVTQPSVVLFDPSPQEIKEQGKATLVCLATNFYPDHVTLRWSVNGKETTTGVKTDDSPTRGSDRMYSLSSRLRLTKREWMNPHNTFRCSVYFDPKNITVSKETKGREDCGLTADSFRTSANTARLTYLLLMSKSALYGILVTLLVLKRKSTN